MVCVVTPLAACRASAFGNNNARAAVARLGAGPWAQHRGGDVRPGDPCKWNGFRAQAEGSIFGLDATRWAVATRAFTFRFRETAFPFAPIPPPLLMNRCLTLAQRDAGRLSRFVACAAILWLLVSLLRIPFFS